MKKKPQLPQEKRQELGKEAGQEVICETRKAMERAGHSMDRIAEGLAIASYSNIKDFFKIDEGGAIQFKPLRGRKTQAIKKIREKTNIAESADGQTIFKRSVVELELYDSLDAKKFSAALMGMVKPIKVDVNAKLDVGIKDARQKLADRLNAIAKRKPKSGSAKRSK